MYAEEFLTLKDWGSGRTHAGSDGDGDLRGGQNVDEEGEKEGKMQAEYARGLNGERVNSGRKREAFNVKMREEYVVQATMI